MSVSSQLKSRLILGCLFLLLTFCFVQSFAHARDNHRTINHCFRHLEQLENSLTNDLLKTRFQLLQHYDSITQKTTLFTDSLSRLETLLAQAIQTSPLLGEHLRTLQASHRQQQTLIEDYKSDLALWVNSSKYLPTALRQAIKAAQAQENGPLLDVLDQAQMVLMAYALNNTAIDQPDIPIILSTLSSFETGTTPPNLSPLHSLIQHLDIIERVRPAVIETIALISQDGMIEQLETLIQEYSTVYQQKEQRRDRYRTGLYTTSLLLLVYLLILYRIQRKNNLLKTVNQSLEEQVAERTQSLNKALLDLKQSQSSLVHSEKMASLGQLVAGIAHEFNNPIGFIHGNLQVIEQYNQELFGLVKRYQQHYPQPVAEISVYESEIDLAFLESDQAQVLASMQNGTQRVQAIVNSLKTFSRLGESGKKPADIHAGIESVILLLQHRLRPNTQRPAIKVQQQYGSLPLVPCYPSELNQAVMHVLSNAIDALDSIDWVNQPSSPEITIETRQQNHAVDISIIDNGPGIPQSACRNIFDPFFTTKPVGQGTGLGLSVTYQIIHDLHNGDIQFDTQSGVGSKFCLSIPLETP